MNFASYCTDVIKNKNYNRWCVHRDQPIQMNSRLTYRAIAILRRLNIRICSQTVLDKILAPPGSHRPTYDDCVHSADRTNSGTTRVKRTTGHATDTMLFNSPVTTKTMSTASEPLLWFNCDEVTVDSKCRRFDDSDKLHRTCVQFGVDCDVASGWRALDYIVILMASRMIGYREVHRASSWRDFRGSNIVCGLNNWRLRTKHTINDAAISLDGCNVRRWAHDVAISAVRVQGGKHDVRKFRNRNSTLACKQMFSSC